MNSMMPEGNLSAPLVVDFADIEKALTSLWNSAAETRHGMIMRACSCNLIAFVRNREIARSFLPVTAKVSERVPSRSIVACIEPDEGLEAPDLHASISAHCSASPSQGPQVCYESILVAARHRIRSNLPDALLSLIVPDLPVYLYWRSFLSADQDLIDKIARFCNQLIVDTHRSSDNPEDRLRILKLLIHRPAGIPIRDLNWARITPWRDLIAQFFDSTNTIRYVREISEIEITRNLSSAGSIPTRTLLLTGWLASSLGWKRISAERCGDTWISTWRAAGNDVRVSFSGTVASPDQNPGINSIRLRAGAGADFVVSIQPGSHCLRADASVNGSCVTHSVPEEPVDEASLLAHELEQMGEDLAFSAALTEAYDLEKAFRECGES